MVFSRQDRIGLQNMLDLILDETEIAARKLRFYHPQHLPGICQKLMQIGESLVKIGEEMQNLVRWVLTDFTKGIQTIKVVTDLRREAREIYWGFMHDIYSQPIDPREFSYYTQFAKSLITVIDLCEADADQIFGLICKYRP